MFDFWTFKTEQEAIDFKKSHRFRKGIIFYSDYWKCWILDRMK